MRHGGVRRCPSALNVACAICDDVLSSICVLTWEVWSGGDFVGEAFRFDIGY